MRSLWLLNYIINILFTKNDFSCDTESVLKGEDEKVNKENKPEDEKKEPEVSVPL